MIIHLAIKIIIELATRIKYTIDFQIKFAINFEVKTAIDSSWQMQSMYQSNLQLIDPIQFMVNCMQNQINFTSAWFDIDIISIC